eukprot:TRINITY_DN56309_c0_g1_i1.p1 TRINITY_DN56309_c0_g1~~TRINITY_DN56309_c0_g1_i1.p1  ORF type:complete len:140 (+),score=35.02 TRINITY_DN56309_c0_g1_i1:69-488(+)
MYRLYIMWYLKFFFFFQAEDGIRDAQESRGLGDVYKRQCWLCDSEMEILEPPPSHPQENSDRQVPGCPHVWPSKPLHQSLAQPAPECNSWCHDFTLQQNQSRYTDIQGPCCLLYTSDAADEEDSVDLGGRRIIKKKKRT